MIIFLEKSLPIKYINIINYSHYKLAYFKVEEIARIN